MNEVNTTAPDLIQHGLVSILMPVYNERAYLRRCLTRVLAAPLPNELTREIVMVNDASTDGTGTLVDSLAAEYPEVIRVFHQPVNQGKGAAIRRAIQEMHGQFAIIQDADLEYDPDEYQYLLRPLVDGHADVVYGSRFASRSMRRVLNFHHSLGNKFLTLMSNVFTGLNLTDMETCYKAFKADVLKTIPLRSNRFGIEPEITAKIAKRQCTIFEVPISYYGRSYAEGKKIGWRDGVSALYTILKYWLLDDCYDERYGHSILGNLSKAHNFNRWMVDILEPYFGQKIIEVGSGIGNLSRYLPKRERLTVTDVDDTYLNLLAESYDGNEVVDCHRLDLTTDEDFNDIGEGKYDTVICLNVLEHIEDHEATLARMRRLLVPGGKLVLLVPQYSWLYGSFDEFLEHFRRYDRNEALALLQKTGYRNVKTFNFNALPILGWWLNAVVLKRQTMSKFQIKIFDMLVPFLRPIEAIVPGLPGMSLVCIAENPGTE